MDLFISEQGDIAVSHTGDLAITPTEHHDDAQQAYVRMMTEIGDWMTYPTLGASLSQLFGMPQSPQTGALGVELINSAMNREGRFGGSSVRAVAVPIAPHKIRFDISIVSGSQEQVRFSVERDLSLGVV